MGFFVEASEENCRKIYSHRELLQRDADSEAYYNTSAEYCDRGIAYFRLLYTYMAKLCDEFGFQPVMTWREMNGLFNNSELFLESLESDEFDEIENAFGKKMLTAYKSPFWLDVNVTLSQCDILSVLYDCGICMYNEAYRLLINPTKNVFIEDIEEYTFCSSLEEFTEEHLPHFNICWDSVPESVVVEAMHLLFCDEQDLSDKFIADNLRVFKDFVEILSYLDTSYGLLENSLVIGASSLIVPYKKWLAAGSPAIRTRYDWVIDFIDLALDVISTPSFHKLSDCCIENINTDEFFGYVRYLGHDAYTIESLAFGFTSFDIAKNLTLARAAIDFGILFLDSKDPFLPDELRRANVSDF